MVQMAGLMMCRAGDMCGYLRRVKLAVNSELKRNDNQNKQNLGKIIIL